jgi:hypothetical protein
MLSFVVATTQASINATMKEFLASRSDPELTVCYVADDKGNPTPIDYDMLKTYAQGIDPFTVPDASGPDPPFDPSTDSRTQKLYNARFMMAFRAKMGIPKVSEPTLVPDIVVLNDGSSSITFNLLCEEFEVVELRPASGWTKMRWLHTSQQPDHPIVFESHVDIRLDAVGSDYSKLPVDVQARIKNLSDTAFSVEQLLFDFSNAGLQTIPEIQGVDPGTDLYRVLETYFIGAYFTHLRKDGQPVLSCTVKQAPTTKEPLVLTDFDFEASPFIGSEADLSTLNYLCMTDHHTQIPPVKFPWNWVSDWSHDGVVSINRNTLMHYFDEQLKEYAPKNCIKVETHCYNSGGVQYETNFYGGQQPLPDRPTSGPVVLSYHYHSDDENQAGVNGNLGSLHLWSDFLMTVEFLDDKIVITQNLGIYMWFRHYTTHTEGMVVQRKLTDTYNLQVDSNGKLIVVRTSDFVNTDEDITINKVLSALIGMNGHIEKAVNAAKDCKGIDLEDIPVAMVSDFVFPGGRTFTYRDPKFSKNQDLVALITYVDPSGQ